MKISFIGAGNVAWHMAQALDRNKHQVIEVFSRNLKNSKSLVEKLYNAHAVETLDFSESKSEIFVICVPDDALTSILHQTVFPSNCIVVHTSGSLSLEALSMISHLKTGVFYPLQTFSKSKQVIFKNIPICIEAINKETEAILEKLAFSICENVCFYSSEDRKILHLAAVIACNFTNHMLTISKKILEKENMDFAVLKPLIQETFEKALLNGPEKSQTGPAVRKDIKTITEHLHLLEKTPLTKEIYKNLTSSIQDSGINLKSYV